METRLRADELINCGGWSLAKKSSISGMGIEALGVRAKESGMDSAKEKTIIYKTHHPMQVGRGCLYLGVTTIDESEQKDLFKLLVLYDPCTSPNGNPVNGSFSICSKLDPFFIFSTLE